MSKKIITESEFNVIKEGLKHLTVAEISVRTGRSESAIRIIKPIASFKDYEAWREQHTLREREFAKQRVKGTKIIAPVVRRGKKGVKNLTAEEFKGLKGMLEYGLTPRVIHVATGRGQTTIRFVDKTKTFEEYRQTLAATRKPKVVEQPKEVKQIEVKEGAQLESAGTTSIDQILSDIAKALANISVELRELHGQIYLNTSTLGKVEERIVDFEDYTKVIAEGIQERRGLFNR